MEVANEVSDGEGGSVAGADVYVDMMMGNK
jgi:hypothetical protein